MKRGDIARSEESISSLKRKNVSDEAEHLEALAEAYSRPRLYKRLKGGSTPSSSSLLSSSRPPADDISSHVTPNLTETDLNIVYEKLKEMNQPLKLFGETHMDM